MKDKERRTQEPVPGLEPQDTIVIRHGGLSGLELPLQIGASVFDWAPRTPCERPTPPASQLSRQLFERGRAYYAQGNSIRSEQYFSQALHRGYPPQEVLPLLLRVSVKSSRLRAAMQHAEVYLREHPEEHALRYPIALIHLVLGHEEQARSQLETLSQNVRGLALPHYLLGLLWSRTDVPRASRHFDLFLALSSDAARKSQVHCFLGHLASPDREENLKAGVSSPLGLAE
ncbi:tetratricopeptide repeat protein [Myxococcota bacterium]